MNKMVKKGDFLECLITNETLTAGTKYMVEMVTSSKYGEFKILNDDGNYQTFSWDGDEFKKA